MKTEKQIRELIKKINEDYGHVLTGTRATIQINAPRALMQLEAEARLRDLHWILDERYETKLRGLD